VGTFSLSFSLSLSQQEIHHLLHESNQSILSFALPCHVIYHRPPSLFPTVVRCLEGQDRTCADDDPKTTRVRSAVDGQCQNGGPSNDDTTQHVGSVGNDDDDDDDVSTTTTRQQRYADGHKNKDRGEEEVVVVLVVVVAGVSLHFQPRQQ